MRKLAISLTLLLVSSFAQAAITGSVVDADGNPLAGVTIRAFAVEERSDLLRRITAREADREPLVTAKTSEAGEFRFDKLAKPTVDLIATAAGRETVMRFAADTEDVPLLMREVKPRRFRVVANGKPVANAIVQEGRPIVMRTGEDGTFELATLSSSPRLVVYHPDYAPLEVNPQRNDTDLKLDAGTALRGRVVGSDGKPVANAEVLIGGWPMAKSGEDGSFTIAHAPSNWRELRAETKTDVAVATRGSNASYTLHLRPGARVTGVVRDAKSRVPVAGMMISIRGDGAITDNAGAFTLAPILPGRYPFGAAHPLYQVESGMGGGGFVVPAAGLKETIAATPLPLVSGTVIDEARKPVAGATVGRATGASTVTRRNGTFAFRAASSAFDSEYEVSKDGYANASFMVSQGASKSGISVTLKRGVPLVVNVIDTDRKPVSGVLVHVVTSGDPNGRMQREIRCGGVDCSTSNDGSLTLKVAPAKYDIWVAGKDIIMKRLSSQTVDARTGPLTITVTRGVEISGRVTYSDGKPISTPVRVTMDANGVPITEATDDAGAFVLHGAPRGRVMVRPQIVEGQRYTGPAKEVMAPASNVVLTIPRGGHISGKVVDAASGSPIADFEVSTMRQAAMSFSPVTTPVHADDGTFTISDVMPGRIDLVAAAEGYVRGSSSGIDVAEGQGVDNVELRLDRAAKVSGQVRSSDGGPLSGVSVSVVETAGRRPGLMGGDRATTDADGEYALTSVPPGQRNFTFNKEGFVAATKSVDAAAGKESRLDATLDRGRQLTGRVIDDSGQAVAGADIRAEGEPARPVQTDSEGGFTLAGLRDGKVHLAAHRNGYVDAREEVDTVAQPNVTLTLTRGATITGRVSGLTADELSNTFVSYYGGFGGYGNTRPDAAGNFSITGVRDGKMTVSASTGGFGTTRTARKMIDVENGSAPPVELVFSTGYTVHGHVNGHGRNLADFNINFSGSDASLAPGMGRLDSDGNYSVAGLGSGDYRVSIMAPMMGVLYNDKFTVSGDGVYDIDLHSSSLRGRVTNRDGAPLSDVRVVAEMVKRTSMTPPPRPAISDSDGRYVIDFIGEGTWRLTAQKEQYQPATRETTVADGAPDVDFQLSPGSMTSVRVVDAITGAPLWANMVVRDDTHTVSTTETNASDGVAQLWLAPGHYTVSVGAQHYALTTTAVDVPGPEVRITLTHGGTIIAVVKDPSTQRVGIMPVGQGVPHVGGMVTSGNNRYDNIAAGTYELRLYTMGNSKAIQTKTVVVMEGATVTVTFD
jgi:protocatechuate 3,4-dioxygenase beta subunit